MSMQDEILEELGTKMQSVVDREILWGILIGMGWTRVKLSRFVDNHHAVDITYWLDEHVKNPFEREGADFIFENSYDAMMFILRWKDGS
jgi:hypothetical protein